MKDLLYERLMNFITPIQKRYNQITDEELETILYENEKKANKVANENMKRIYNAIGM
jgi:tryptophanyl-tRNA synthetase